MSRPAQAPPASEQLHLPGPSYQPLAVSIGSAIAIVGVVVNLYLAAIGLLITFVAIMRWVRGAREELASLPLEHH
jgi:type IV secretory pathway TrbD component